MKTMQPASVHVSLSKKDAGLLSRAYSSGLINIQNYTLTSELIFGMKQTPNHKQLMEELMKLQNQLKRQLPFPLPEDALTIPLQLTKTEGTILLLCFDAGLVNIQNYDITTALVFSVPQTEDDKEFMKELMSLQGKLYKQIVGRDPAEMLPEKASTLVTG
jgi:hypothetical protein